MQGYVAIGAVDDGAIFGAEMNWVPGLSDHEIGNVDVAVGFDVLQNSLKFVFAEERSGDACKDAEVGVFERVLTGYGSLSGGLGIPRTELAVGVNFSGWERIVNGDGVGKWCVAADRG